MSPVDLAARRPRAALLALALVVAFAFQGSRGLYETTEGRYAESALEMIRSGDWLRPTLAGRPHWTKPPLAYWTIAAGVAVAGPTGWGARLSAGLFFALTVLLVAAMGATLWDPPTGLVAGLVYLSSPFPAAAGAVVSTDTLLAFLEVLAIWLYLRAWRADAPGPARRSIRAMWVVWGLAFLTKGPPGLLPLVAILVFQRLSPRRPRLADPIGLVAFAVTAFSWYAWVTATTPGLLSYFLKDEVVGRAVTNEFGRNPEWWKPFVIYLPALLLGQGAWIVATARLARSELSSPRAIWARIRRGDAASFLLLWLTLPLAVLWLSSSRLPLYVLPLYGAIALAAARAVTRRLGPEAPRRALAVAIPSALVLVVLKAGSAWAAPATDKDMARLYAAVERAAGPSADVRTYEEGRLYGLQFYLDGALRRVSRDGKAWWADEPLDAALGAVRAAPERPHVFVTPTRHAAALEAAVAGAGLSCRRVAAGGRSLCVVPAASAARVVNTSGGAP